MRGISPPCELIETRSPFRRAAKLIEGADSILLVAHVNPDGDTLGCVLALYHALKGMGKQEVHALCHDPVPEIYRFLPGWEVILSEVQSLLTADLAIACDMNQLNRAGKHEELLRRARHVILVDHHVPHERVGDVRLVEPDSGATTEIVYRWLRRLRVPFTSEIATCLLTGLVTDTFSFKFPNTTARSLRIAAKLKEYGADISYINEQVFETRSFSAVKLMGLALSTLQTTPEGQIAWVKISRAAFQQAGASDEETEGLVNFVRSVRGVEVAILMREVKEGRVRVSLRSRGKVDVAAIAQIFGGGGHENAAGCTLHTSLAEAERRVLNEVQKWMAFSTSTSRSEGPPMRS
ncbi:MAG: bifunctional oligoribonuclease/PAP phosphatase NrnA [candidate division WOR-3 bacterium]